MRRSGRTVTHIGVTIVLSTVALSDARLPDKVHVFDTPMFDVEADSQSTHSNYFKPIVLNSRSEEIGQLVFFSRSGDCQHVHVHPVIAVFRNGVWNTVSFDAPAFRSHHWTHVYRTYYQQSPIYGISRAYCGDSGAEIFIYRSFDHGTSWEVSGISMHYLSNFLTMRIESDGKGEIIVESNHDPGPAGGHRVYTTTDWGATWSQPVFSESILSARVEGTQNQNPPVSAAQVMLSITEEYKRQHNQP